MEDIKTCETMITLSPLLMIFTAHSRRLVEYAVPNKELHEDPKYSVSIPFLLLVYGSVAYLMLRAH